MESYYGIGVKNRYEMFYDDDSDPVELLKKTQAKKKEKAAEKENKIKEKPKEAPKKQEKNTNGNIPEKKQEIVNHREAPRDKKDIKKTDRVRFTDREERNNQRNTVDSGAKESRNGPNQRFNGEMRGRGRGRGGKPEEFTRSGKGSNSDDTNRSGRGSDEFNRVGRQSNSEDFRNGGKVSSSSEEFGRGKGNRRGRGSWSDRGGKREFDRQSGMATSGVKPVDKKDGAGSYNWGSNKADIDAELLTPHDQENDSDSADKAKSTGSESKENELPKEEEGAKEMTLDEWKALQKRERPQFNVRKPGEGENEAQWKKTYVLKKKEEVEEVAAGETADADAHQGKRKVLLPIDFQFSDAPMRGGRFRGRGRGGPGTGRGRGGRGARGGRGFVSRPEAPKMDDEKVFPSLG